MGRVAAGTGEDLTDINGNFSISDVPAGRQGSPISIRALATARDIEFSTYTWRDDPVVATQSGTTSVGQIKMENYATVITPEIAAKSGRKISENDVKIALHADYGNAAGEAHVIKVASSHANEPRYQNEVEEIRAF